MGLLGVGESFLSMQHPRLECGEMPNARQGVALPGAEGLMFWGDFGFFVCLFVFGAPEGHLPRQKGYDNI